MYNPNPFSNSLHKILWLRFKTDGAILELFPYRFGHFVTIHNALKQSKNVNRYFDLPESIVNEKHLRLYNRKEALFFDEGYDDFYTSLSVIGMTCSRISDDEFFGVIFISEVLPVMFDENDRSTLIYLDTENKLVGFTEGLCTFFKDSCIESKSLLDRPASEFLEILPDKSQKDKIAVLKNKIDTGWIKNCEHEHISSNWNRSNTLELGESINASQEDLKLTF
ncbi:MAG: hypothetical protein JNL74_16015, partial [Fibrobacteres bacterium]|nr:hypothetical protein [Fibrobacterota bacterium]